MYLEDNRFVLEAIKLEDVTFNLGFEYEECFLGVGWKLTVIRIYNLVLPEWIEERLV